MLNMSLYKYLTNVSIYVKFFEAIPFFLKAQRHVYGGRELP